MIRMVFSIYRWLVSPFLHFLAGPGAGCRFAGTELGTCSEFAERMIREKGLLRGGLLSLRRLACCQPFYSGEFGGRHA